MKEEKFNPLIKAVQSLRKLALDIKTGNDNIQKNDKNSRTKVEEAGKLIVKTEDNKIIDIWLKEKSKLLENTDELLNILKIIETKFKNKDTTGLLEIWESHGRYKDIVITTLDNMKNIGEVIFVDEKLYKWNNIWKEITEILNNILAISETYHLKFSMMQSLSVSEIDELTNDILTHIPWNYSDEEAANYEQEYMAAYYELKASQSKKKNLWDKILDILAGGVEETPAHMVQMRRWMDGNNDQ